MQFPSQRSPGIILTIHHYAFIRGTTNPVCHNPQAFWKQPQAIEFFTFRLCPSPQSQIYLKGLQASFFIPASSLYWSVTIGPLQHP